MARALEMKRYFNQPIFLYAKKKIINDKIMKMRLLVPFEMIWLINEFPMENFKMIDIKIIGNNKIIRNFPSILKFIENFINPSDQSKICFVVLFLKMSHFI